MAASAVSAKGVAGNADAALAAAQDNSRRVTPDATVEHVRKKMHPDNVFTTPVVPQISPELSTMAYIAQLRLHRQRQYEAARGAEEATHRAKSVAVARPVSVAAASPTAGSPASPASPKAADTDNGGGDDDDDDGQVALDNDDTDEIYGSSPLHIAARKNRVRDIRLWVQSYSKNTLDNRDFTPLMVAASHNSVKALVLLLRMGVRKDDVDCKTQRTALHWAVLHGHSASVLSLLQYGADARFRDRDGRTPVHLAALHPKPDCLKIILRFVNPEALLEGDNEQMAPFHLAVMCDNVRHLQLMMSLRPPIFMTTGDVEGKTALHWCAQNLDAKTYAPTFFHTPKTCATLLIENQPLLVGIKDLEGRTALHLACSVGNIPLIVEVCSQLQIPSAHVKAIVNTQDLHGRTALHYAAIAGQAYILRVLRHYGADDGLADKDGATPLHYACSKNHGQCVSILISDNRLRYTYTRDNQGRTPIMWAVIKGYSEALRILLEAGVNPSEIDDKRTTALHICGAGGHAHCASLLLEHGATVDVRNADQRSALFLAVQHGHGETANVLIQHGANVSMLDSEQRSPLHWAALCGHLSVVSLLISCNGQVDHQDSEGKTPLHCAA
ncbi:ankyrin repeat-containing domain protein [Entophlyctis helioformis]|nr:ankyrin repeat-containing domain protein [Entophlyctis helioformis]